MAKLPIPGNLEAEKAVLGSIISNQQAANMAMSSMSEDMFSGLDPRNPLVFRAMRMLVESKQPIDPMTLHGQLVTMQLAETVGSPEYLLELADASLNPANVEFYVSIVRDNAVLRDFLKEIDKIENEYVSGKVEDISAFLMGATELLAKIASRRSVGNFRSAYEVSKEVSLQLSQYRNYSNRRLTGVDTGFQRLNDLTHGWQNDSLNIIAARPSVGKTALAINMIYSAATRTKKPVAFFSGEQSAREMVQRLIAAEAIISYEDIQLGRLNEEDNRKVLSALKNIAQAQIYFDDTPNPQVSDIVAKAQKLKSSHPDLCAIFVDHLNIIQTSATQKIDSRPLQLAYITSTLKELARNLHLPVIALAQLNRDADKAAAENGAPTLANLKESSAIEQDADLVIMMYRPDYYDPKPTNKQPGAPSTFQEKAEAQVAEVKAHGKDAGDSSVVTLKIRKARNGRLGDTTLHFEKAYMRFSEFSNDAQQELEEM